MNTIPASGDWYFIHPIAETDQTNIFPVAAWSEQKDGDIVGLIGHVESRSTGGKYARLVLPPPVDGMYIKRNPVNTGYIDSAMSGQKVLYSKLREL